MSKYNPVFIILALGLLIGVFTFDRYGESWDEESLQKYAVKSLAAYDTWSGQGAVNLGREDLAYYGPFYVMLVEDLATRLSLAIDTHPTDIRHFLYFVTYLAGVFAFYGLAVRWLKQTPAIGVTLLFMSQPVLWGHAFINPKDTPFLSLFLLSIFLGLRFFDLLETIQKKETDLRSKRKSALLTALWLVSVFSLFIFTQAIHDYIASLVLSAQAGNTNIFTLIAKNIAAVPAETYTRRYFLLFLQVRMYYTLLITALLLYVWYKFRPDLLKTFLIILLPAVFLGFATSTRILGPFAGLIVALFALQKKGRQALPALAMYAVAAMIATYLTWPYLWMNPIGRFFESLNEMSLYPWAGVTLFNGVGYKSTDLPYSYLPVLLGIQLTEPVWVLAIAGWIVAIVGGVKKRGLVALSLLWFVIPLIGFIIFRAALYDNFRQILFILPPIFLMAGVAIERLKNVNWQIMLISVCLIPSAVGIGDLYPYEYIYYNSFVGGVNGAAGRFETDYWAISYREAAEYVNDVASPNANIWVEGPAQSFSLFARGDLKIYSAGETDRAESYEYVIATTRYGLYQVSYPDAEIVHRIMRENAVLTVIKNP